VSEAFKRALIEGNLKPLGYASTALSFIKKWRPTYVTRDFTRNMMSALFRRGGETVESIIVILQTKNICFWKDGCPLEGCAVEPLALPAVTVLRIERVACKSKTHSTALAGRLVFCLEDLLAVRTTRWKPAVWRL